MKDLKSIVKALKEKTRQKEELEKKLTAVSSDVDTLGDQLKMIVFKDADTFELGLNVIIVDDMVIQLEYFIDEFNGEDQIDNVKVIEPLNAI